MENKQLELLMSYTVFHVGVYVSLIAALIGVGLLTQKTHWLFRWAVGCFLIAGICGAVIGSNIPDHATFESFSKSELGFWGFEIRDFRFWAALEHLAFWAGIGPVAVMFLIKGPKAFDG